MSSVKGEIESRIEQRRIALERWFTPDVFTESMATAIQIEKDSDLLRDRQRSIEQLRTSLHLLRESVQQRRRKLSQFDRSILPSRSAIIKNLNFQLESLISQASKASSEALSRRGSLLRQLNSDLYPIEFHGKFRSIRGLALPSIPGLKRYESRDEESISTALGYLVHWIVLTARISDFPLKLALVPAGSRSLVKDPLSVPSLQEYPLFMKATEKQRFLTAIQMLQDTIFHFLKHRTRESEISPDLLEMAERFLT
jgi:hypothetical protein